MTIAVVTGANGYVGGIIRSALATRVTVKTLVRTPRNPADIAWSFDTPVLELAELLRANKVTHIFHAAWDMKASRLAALESGCVAGSQRLLQAASFAAVQNFTFISTISAFEGARSAYGQAKLQVERLVLAAGGNVLRPGLVYGEAEGGMFGSLRNSLRRARLTPMIGNGTAPQYLLHERMLAEAVLLALAPLPETVTLANPQPIRFRDLLRLLARQQQRHPILLPVPWQGLYAGLKTAELLGLKPGFKSDSVLSFVFQNPAPDFEPMLRLGLKPVPLPV